MIRLILFTAIVSILAQTAFSQQKFAGRVIDIVDGKTVVIEMATGKITAVLQHIEVPEPEQPLHATVKEHLGKLVLGKIVVFHPRGISPHKTVGRLVLDDVDVSQKMLRDGAAWHEPLARSGQNPTESEDYRANESQAKAEKRGVWSIAGLKPAWEFRAEKKEDLRRQEQLILAQYAAKTREAQASPTRPATSVKASMWADTNPAIKNVGALLSGYNAEKKTGYIATPFLGVREMQGEGHLQKTVASISYFYTEDDKKGRNGTFVIQLESSSTEWRFLKSNNLVLMADGKDIVVGKAKRIARQDGDSFREGLTYRIDRSTLDRFANGKDVVLKIGNYLIIPTEGFQLLVYNLLQVSAEARTQ